MTLLRRLLSFLAPSTANQPAYARAFACGRFIAAFGVTAAVLAGLRAAETAPDASQLAKEIIGTWVSNEHPGNNEKGPKSGGRYRTFDGKEWLITQFDPETNEVIYRQGGTYTFERGDQMVITSRGESAGKPRRFRVQIEGDILTLRRVGYPYTEVWRRISTEMPAKGPTEEVALRQAMNNSREITNATWYRAFYYYLDRGRYTNALRVLENARAYLRHEGKAESPEFVALTIWLGVVLSAGLGQLEEAAKAYQEADDICIDLYGRDSIERAAILNRKCQLLALQKRFTEAAAVGRESVRLMTKHRGPSNPETADALHFLALALADLPDTGETEKVLKRVVDIRRSNKRNRPLSTGIALNNLGAYYLQTKRPQEARKALFAAASIYSKSAFPQSPDGMSLQRNMIRLESDAGNRWRAAILAETLFSNELILFHKSFPALDENGRLDLKSRFEPGRWLCTLGEPKPIARALLQTKAITLDQMLALPTPQASVDDRFAYLLRPENAAQGLLPYSPAPVDAAAPAQSLPKFGSAAGVSKSPPFSLYSITPEQVCASLPSDTVIVEFTRYNHYVGWFVDEERYGALVFRSDSKGAQSLQWVPLGAAAKIDHEVSSLLESATDPLASGTLATRLRELHESIWAPIAKTIPAGTQNLFICPDGQLCFLPFSTLLDPQGLFLADRFLVMYLATARDLFQTDLSGRIETDQFAVFAAPSFDKTTATQDGAPAFTFRDADARSLQDLQLADLPGARREAGILKTLASERQLTPDVFTGEAANKANVGKLERPRIVHFATHGFMLPPAVTTAFSNPMDRSGLALAGAQVSLTAMANGQPLPPVGDDGLLTAREVAQLNWQGTWLVTLSACSTGRGEVRDGESVLGLRRGFLAAGVENLLLSLWKISDEETVGFMRDFYTHALDSSDPATALALTQREWLARIRKERGIAAAVSTAGAFVLNTSARLPRPVGDADAK